MRRTLIAGFLTASAAAALLSDGPEPAPHSAQKDPSFSEMRAEIFLPHYECIRGMIDGLPSEDLATRKDLMINLALAQSRFGTLSADWDLPVYAHCYEQGRSLALSGDVAADGVNDYLDTVLQADSIFVQTWHRSTQDLSRADLYPSEVNYLSLHAMSADIEAFEARFPLIRKAEEQIADDGWAPFQTSIQISYDEAAAASREVYEMLDIAHLSIMPTGFAGQGPTEFAMEQGF